MKRSVRWDSTPTSSRTVVGLRAAQIPKRGLNLFGRQRPLCCGLPLRRRLTQALEAAGGADSKLRIRGRGSSQEPEPTPQHRELDELLGCVEVVPTAAPTDHLIFSSVELPNKDRPVLLAAIGVGATHLLTGDFWHYMGPYRGKRIQRVLILSPRDHLSLRDPDSLPLKE